MSRNANRYETHMDDHRRTRRPGQLQMVPGALWPGSPSQQIAKAVAWLKQNFVETLNGDDLADRAHMSPSSFRQHFRASPG
jgi:transcriptional regulator GlxA family with amidase domain